MQSSCDKKTAPQADFHISKLSLKPIPENIQSNLSELQSLKQLDDLENWLYAIWDIQAEIFDDNTEAIHILYFALDNMWRSPGNAEEAEALAHIYINLGYHSYLVENILSSVRHYESALSNIDKFHIWPDEVLGWIYLPLGAHYTRLGDNEKARVLYRNVLQKLNGKENAEVLAGIYNNLGLAFWNDGMYEEAKSSYEEGLRLDSISIIKKSMLNFSLAQCYFDMDSLSKAQALVTRSKSFLQSFESEKQVPEDIQILLTNMYLLSGQLKIRAGKLFEAETVLHKALEYQNKTSWTGRELSKNLVDLGNLYLKLDDQDKAVLYFENALNNLISYSSFDSIQSDFLYAENTFIDIFIGLASSYMDLFHCTNEIRYLLSAHHCYKYSNVVESKLRQQYIYNNSKLNLVAQSKKRSSEHLDIIYQLHNHLQDESFVWEALLETEQNKSVLLLDAIRIHYSRQFLMSPELILHERELKQALHFHENEFGKSGDDDFKMRKQIMLNQLKALQDSVSQLSTTYNSDFSLPVNEENIRSIARERDILVLFETETYLHSFFIDNNGIKWSRTPITDSLNKLVQNCLTNMRSRTGGGSSSEYAELTFRLFETLFQDEIQMKDINHSLLIVPDGRLSGLPFEALVIDRENSDTWEGLHYLVKSRAIYYAYSLAVHSVQSKLEKTNHKHLIQFAPSFAESGSLTNLNYIEKEVESVCWSMTPLTGDNANVAGFRKLAPSGSIIHISSHAGLTKDSLQPYIELADRKFTATEVFFMDLNADLMVLSACETAIGKDQYGEGAMSLSRAFSQSGIRSIAATLWKIPEFSTANICNKFYDHLCKGISKPLALNDSKLDYLNDKNIPSFQKTPYFWAGMVYLGDNDVLPGNSAPISLWIVLVFASIISITFLVILKTKSK